MFKKDGPRFENGRTGLTNKQDIFNANSKDTNLNANCMKFNCMQIASFATTKNPMQVYV